MGAMAESSSSTVDTVTLRGSGVGTGLGEAAVSGAALSAVPAGASASWPPGPRAAAQPHSSSVAVSSRASPARLRGLYFIICSNLSLRFRFSVAKLVATRRREREELSARESKVSP